MKPIEPLAVGILNGSLRQWRAQVTITRSSKPDPETGLYAATLGVLPAQDDLLMLLLDRDDLARLIGEMEAVLYELDGVPP